MRQSISATYVSSVLLILVALLGFASSAEAKSNLDVAVWVPYWQEDEGIASVEDNLRDIDTIHPFVYEVREDGSISRFDALKSKDWKSLIKKAKRKRVEIIPTLTWFDGDAIHEVLSDPKKRKAHIEVIAHLVDENNFDGIDIDYEGKLAETKDYFSLFLKELKDELGRDALTCTIEARTPPESKWREVPRTIEYSNDFKAIGRYCDRVEIMAYDQQRIDWKLNTERAGEPYIPVADADWVEKVLKLALEDIDEDKIMLGVPTYGREWIMTVAPDWYKDYERIQSVNLPEAEDIREKYNKEFGRNQAGEASFTYFPEDSPFKVLEALPVPEGTRKGNEAAAKALLFANATGMTVPVNVVWISDAKAIEDKVELAEKYDLRGIAIFKVDGEEDEELWDLF